MAKESERVRVMKENFMNLHNAGYSIPQIAEQHNLDKMTVYRHLQEIADANNVSRESLLQIVRSPSERAIQKEEERKARITVEELRQGYKEVGQGIDSLKAKISEIFSFFSQYFSQNLDFVFTNAKFCGIIVPT